MTKLLVLSDSHGARDAIKRILNKEQNNVDAVIFLGDGLRDLEQTLAFFPHLRVYSVAGNCDFGALEPLDGLAGFDQTVVFYTHGHMYGVRYAGRCCRRPGGRGGAVRPLPHPPRRAAGQCIFVQPRLLRALLHRPGHLRSVDTGKRRSDRL